MENQLSKIKFGILGGGQLARMMALKSHEMGLKPYVLCKAKNDPAAQVTSFYVQGLLDSRRDLKNFLQQVDIATFENEFLDTTLLQKTAFAVKTLIHPKPQVMQLLQDRLHQKKLFQKYKIPTARYVAISSKQEINNVNHLFPKGMALKKRRQGYDGYGTRIVKNITQDKASLDFVVNNINNLIAEELIPFKREMALILVRNRRKQVIELPLVETYQEEARCLWVKGPRRHRKKAALVKKLKAMLDHLNYEGVMAFELFETKQSKLLVNELAPRVHNSGHYSLDALSEDQFSLHIKAVLNLKIKTPDLLVGGFAMLNLLGRKNYQLPSTQASSGKLHWYGKSDARPGRKMGHINFVAGSVSKAFAQLLQFKKDHSL